MAVYNTSFSFDPLDIVDFIEEVQQWEYFNNKNFDKCIDSDFLGNRIYLF